MKKELTDKRGEVRELTADDFKAMGEPSSVLPEELVVVLPRRGRPKAARPKKTVDYTAESGCG